MSHPFESKRSLNTVNRSACHRFGESGAVTLVVGIRAGKERVERGDDDDGEGERPEPGDDHDRPACEREVDRYRRRWISVARRGVGFAGLGNGTPRRASTGWRAARGSLDTSPARLKSRSSVCSVRAELRGQPRLGCGATARS